MSDQLDQPMAVDEALQVAISHHQLGRLTEAEAIYRQVLAAHPHHPDALHFLGLIAHQLGNNALAQELIENAIQVNPNNPAYYSNLGFVVREQGRVDEAINHYQYAIQLQPDYADAHYNLGVALKAHGQLDGAINCYQRVIALQSDYAQAYSDLGIALRDQGRLDEAVSRYQHAIGLQPDYADAHSNLGLALQEQGKLDEAISCYQRAIALKPDFAEAHYNLGGALHECGLFDEAISRYSKTLALNPDLVEAHYNFGNVLHEVGQIDAAISCYQRAIALKPDFARAHNNLGNALKDLGQLISAVSSYRRALTIKADYAKAHSNLLFTYNYLCHQAADVLLGEAQRFGDAVELQARPFSTWCINAQIDRCLRVGLVSGDFRVHPVGFFIESVLAALTADAADQLHFFAYTTNLRADALSARIEACCDGWQSVVGLSDQRLAQLIHDDEIDILIDLSGHTGRNRLPMFAYKPAPIQVSWLGYFATTGVAAIDYLLADPWTLPPSEEAHFSEKIWRLPETRLCFTAPDVALEVAPLPALRNAYVTFGCFNNLTKMNDAVVALWARVLRAVPSSRLFLKAAQLAEPSVRDDVLRRFAVHAIDEQRLMLEGPDSREAYLSAYHRVDIALDPFPFPGGTVSAEGLWMGVPVLTLAGQRFLSRQGLGLLMNAGLADWIAADEDDYVARACSHAADLQGLVRLRGALREQVLATPLFDAARFAGHFEAVLRAMWTQWCNGQTR